MAYGFGSTIMENNFSSLLEGSSQLSYDIKSVVASMNAQTAQLEKILSRFTSYEEEFHIDQSSRERNHTGPPSLSQFYGNDPESWIDQATRYFNSKSMSDSDRFVISSYYLEGEAAIWFNSLHHRFQLTTWTAFTVSMVDRFGVKDVTTLQNQSVTLASMISDSLESEITVRDSADEPQHLNFVSPSISSSDDDHKGFCGLITNDTGSVQQNQSEIDSSVVASGCSSVVNGPIITVAMLANTKSLNNIGSLLHKLSGLNSTQPRNGSQLQQGNINCDNNLNFSSCGAEIRLCHGYATALMQFTCSNEAHPVTSIFMKDDEKPCPDVELKNGHNCSFANFLVSYDLNFGATWLWGNFGFDPGPKFVHMPICEKNATIGSFKKPTE